MSFRRKPGGVKSSSGEHFPVKSFENSFQHTAILGGFLVVVENEESVKVLHGNGCFGAKISGKLVLLKEEAFFLHFCLKCLRISQENQEILSTEEILERFCCEKSNFLSSYVAYQYLRSRRWVIKSGVKFGGDFLLYRDGPESFHSSYVVFLEDQEKPLTGRDVQGLYRITENSGKELVILRVIHPEDCYSPQQYLRDKFRNFSVQEVNPRRFTFHSTK